MSLYEDDSRYGQHCKPILLRAEYCQIIPVFKLTQLTYTSTRMIWLSCHRCEYLPLTACLNTPASVYLSDVPAVQPSTSLQIDVSTLCMNLTTHVHTDAIAGISSRELYVSLSETRWCFKSNLGRWESVIPIYLADQHRLSLYSRVWPSVLVVNRLRYVIWWISSATLHWECNNHVDVLDSVLGVTRFGSLVVLTWDRLSQP